jgi:protein O-GlcNAc transferase
VVTLAGDKAVGRGSVSVLTNIGLPDLIAQTRRDYVDIAVNLAKNPHRRAELRETMRDRMRGSALMNAPAFMQGIENAYRAMWREWCRQ